jgi:hypothetical protein
MCTFETVHYTSGTVCAQNDSARFHCCDTQWPALTFQSLAVTVCTTSLYFQKFYILPTKYFYLSKVSQGKTSKLSLYNPQRSDFITEEASVYYAVRPGPLNKMDYFSHTGRASWYCTKFLFIHQLMYNRIVLKTILKFTLKLTLKQLRHVSV